MPVNNIDKCVCNLLENLYIFSDVILMQQILDFVLLQRLLYNCTILYQFMCRI